MRRPLAVLFVLATLASACGSSGGDTETAAPDTTASEPAAAAGGEEAAVATDAPPSGAGGEEAASNAIAVSLVEWAVEAPTEYAAGTVTFDVTNPGSFAHEFVVIAGENYEALPLEANGAVIESDLKDGAILARTERLGTGESEQLSVDLVPGNYVFLCNIAVGPNSHAGAGQVLNVTVN